jgi:LysM domain
MSTEQRFDDLTRELADEGISRGRVLRLLGAVLLSVLSGGGGLLSILAKPAQASHLGHWGLPYQRDSCTSRGFRQYSAILWDIPWGVSWWTACAHTPGAPAGIPARPPDRCRRRTNMWGEWDVPDSSCPHWGEFKPVCTDFGRLTTSAVLQDCPANEQWDAACRITPGWEGRVPDFCTSTVFRWQWFPQNGQWVRIALNAWGEWYEENPNCCYQGDVETWVDENNRSHSSCWVSCPGQPQAFHLIDNDCLSPGPRWFPMTQKSVANPQNTYVVQSGDTLSEIAAQLGTTTEALVAANGIPDPNLIYAGQLLQY